MRPVAPDLDGSIDVDPDPTIALAEPITHVRRMMALADIEAIDEARFEALGALVT